MHYWQVTLRPGKADIWFPGGEADRRTLARLVLTWGEHHGLVAFRASRQHLRILLRGSRRDVGRSLRDLALTLRHGLGMKERLTRTWLARAGDVARARALLAWVLVIPGHRSLWDPRHEASSLPDLLGLRALAPWSVARVRALDPNWRPGRWRRYLGVWDLDARFDPDLLVTAACAAGAVATLDSKDPATVATKAAAIAYAADMVGVVRAGAILGLGRTASFRLAAARPSPASVRAVALQMSLRMARWKMPRRRARYRVGAWPHPAHTAAAPSAL